MSNDRVGRRPEEIDEARHSRAKGTVVVRAIADELTQIAVSGGKIRLGKLKHLHSQLFKVYQLLDGHIGWSMEDELATFADDAALDAYRDTFSDGTPVSIGVGPPSSRDWRVPGNVHDCGIPWLPNTTGNDSYDADGPIPPGCKVVVVDPPHRRKSTARAARQDGGSAFKDLKARLLEAER